ncbi:hypothetical protein [Lysinibacillus xylanilyticus]|uniref:hypothetical protein n=1 Tax=Lysinibacillus xylanilyticus TaxID=582475 RepID=UPI003CFD495F
MEKTSLILSIIASLGTIVSLIWNAKNTKAIKTKTNNKRSINSKGGKGNINNTGDDVEFK